jgi:hypothetical protein
MCQNIVTSVKLNGLLFVFSSQLIKNDLIYLFI